MWMTLLFCGTAAVFLSMTLVTLWHLRWVQRLPAIETFPPSNTKVRCSIVIAARDEEARMEQTLRQLLAQREMELEVIVVDDRSKDGTGEILRRLAQEDSRVKVKRVDMLPEGWLGKCHACHIGASAATGDWILFTDADCWLKPDMIARAVRLAERENVDHIALAFAPSSRNLGLRASHLLFLIGTANWISGANRDTGKRHIGFGSFNLVRRAVYQQCGGYEALRLTVLDDVKLGLLVQRAGKRTRAFLGGDEVECHFGTNAFSIVKLMEKNYFAALEYRTPLVILGSAAMIFFSTVVILGLLSATSSGLAAAFSPLSLIVPGIVLANRLRWSWMSALLIPVMFPIFHYALVNSAFVTLHQGGIRWRETFYPLAQLRAGNVK
jgi:glycosyltransferase involved in cell wall biosynthesis